MKLRFIIEKKLLEYFIPIFRKQFLPKTEIKLKK